MRDNYSDFRTLSGTVNSILYALYVAISDEDVATCICFIKIIYIGSKIVNCSVVMLIKPFGSTCKQCTHA